MNKNGSVNRSRPINLITLLIVLGFIQLSLSLKCVQVINGALFYLNDVDSTTQDHEVVNYNGDQIYWNLCHHVQYDCQKQQGFAVLESESGDCQMMSGSDPDRNIKFRLLDQKHPELGISSQYHGHNLPFQLKVELYCDDSAMQLKDITLNSHKGEFIIKAKVAHACPQMSILSFWTYIKENNALGFLIFFTVGLLVCFLGLTLVQPIMMIIGFLTGAFVSSTLFFQLLVSPEQAGWLDWHELMQLSVLVGLIVGYYACIEIDFGYICLGILSGGILGIIVYYFSFSSFDHHKYFFYTVVLIMSIFGGYLSYKLKQQYENYQYKILSVALFSFLGAYFVLLSITLITYCNLAFINFDPQLFQPSIFTRIMVAFMLVIFTLLGAFSQISVKGFHPQYLQSYV